MKKALALLVSLILIFGITVTASAASTAVSLNGVPNELKKGERATVTVSLANSPEADSALIQFTLDNGLELVSGEWKTGGMIEDFNLAEREGVMTVASLKTFNGTVFSFVVSGKNASASAQNITVKLTLKNGTADVGTATATKSVKITCSAHTYTAYTKADDDTHERTCTACGHKETSSHTWNAGTVTKHPTCKETGLKHLKCTACNAEKDETIPVTNNHNWGNYEVKVKPSCITQGTQIRECSVCKKTETASIPATGHSFTNPTITKQPTCTESGEESGHCSRCGQTASQSIKPLGHKFSNWSDTKAPTCTEGGIQERKCTVCGTAETRNTSALGHDFENPTVIKEPTISETGLKEGKCKRCGQTASEVIPCSVKDEATGTLFEANEGTFEKGSEIRVEEIKEDNPAFESVKNILKDICKKFKLYDITAYLNGAKIQPNGEVTVTFNIPEGFGKNVAVYYITEDGSYEKLESAVSEDGKTVSAKISHFSNYAVCKISEETDEVMKDETNNATEAKNGQSNKIWIIVLTAVILLAGAGTGAFFYIRKKKQLNRFFED